MGGTLIYCKADRLCIQCEKCLDFFFQSTAWHREHSECDGGGAYFNTGTVLYGRNNISHTSEHVTMGPGN